MPLPLVPIVAVAAAAGLVGIGSVGAKRRLDGKALLLIGSPASGTGTIAKFYDGTDSEVEAPWRQRVRDRANKLIAPKLNVLVTDAPTEGELDAVSDQVTRADIICLVVTTHETHDHVAMASSTRLAKLIGELADKKTKSILVVNHEDSPTDTALVDSRGALSTTTISDLIGASQVWEGDLNNPPALADLAETILSVLTNKK